MELHKNLQNNFSIEKCIGGLDAAQLMVFEERQLAHPLVIFLRIKQSKESISNESESVREKILAAYSSLREFSADGLKEIVQDVTQENPHLEISLTSIVDKRLVSAQKGELNLLLFRGGQLVALASQSPIKTTTVTGSLMENDRLILATSSFFQLISKSELQNTLASSAAVGLSEILMPKIHGSQESITAGLVSFSFGSTSSGETEIVTNESVGLRRRIVNALDSVIAKIPDRKVRVNSEDYYSSGHNKGKIISIVGVALLAVLLISIVVGMRQKGAQIARQQYEPQLVEAQRSLSEARELAEISPPRARELVLQSKKITQELLDQGVEDDELNSLIDEVNNSLAQLAGIYETKAELFLDLSLISSGFKGDDVDLSGGVVRVLDKEGKRLAGVDADTKRTEVITGPQYLPDAISVAGYADRSFILSRDGIREVTDDVELQIKTEKWDSDKVLISAFAGNMYVLDRGNNKIWRYSGVTGGFLDPQNWLSEDVNLDLSGATAWSIDGYVWIVSEGGAIMQLSQGVPVKFSPSMADGTMQDPVDIYTSDETGGLYILDPAGKHILVLDKTGQFLAEYKADELADATKIVVSEQLGKIVVLANSKLYQIDIKHIK